MEGYDIDVIKKATEKYGAGDRRIVLIHGQTLRKDQITQLKVLNIIPSLFPMHTFYWGEWHKYSVLERCRLRVHKDHQTQQNLVSLHRSFLPNQLKP